MSEELTSVNPVVKAIITGAAPRPAQIAAARGMLPLPQADLFEVLAALARQSDEELATAAQTTLAAQEKDDLEIFLKSSEAAPSVLSYFAAQSNQPKQIYEAIISNPKTTSPTITKLVRETSNGELLEIVALNQQLLISSPLSNS